MTISKPSGVWGTNLKQKKTAVINDEKIDERSEKKIFWFTDTSVDTDQYLSGYRNTSFMLVY